MKKKEKDLGYHFRDLIKLPDILTLANAFCGFFIGIPISISGVLFPLLYFLDLECNFYTPVYLILGATMISHLIIRRFKVRGIEKVATFIRGYILKTIKRRTKNGGHAYRREKVVSKSGCF